MKKRSLSRAIITHLKKRGLSTIIATLLLIVVSLIVIAILWVVVSNIISQNIQTTTVQNQFFNQNVNFAQVQLDPSDSLKLNASLKTSSGTVASDSTQIITAPPSQVDLASVSDVSGSMRTCFGVTINCCINTIHGFPSGGNSANCDSFPSLYVNRCVSPCGGILSDGLNASENANKQLVSTIFQSPKDSNRISLVTYATTVINSFSSNMTNNNSLLNAIIGSWEATGSTCICCGLNTAKGKFSDSPNDRPKAIILMSDGGANIQCSQQGTGNSINDTIKAACDAYSQVPNLTIYTIGLGADVDVSTMTAIANCGHGKYFSASQVGDLVGIYQSLADQIITTSAPFNKFNYLKVIFYDSVGNQTIININIPGPLETKKYQFDLNGKGLVGPIVKMEIYPVSTTQQGKEVIGTLLDSWKK